MLPHAPLCSFVRFHGLPCGTFMIVLLIHNACDFANVRTTDYHDSFTVRSFVDCCHWTAMALPHRCNEAP